MGACISRNITDTRGETLQMGTVGTYRVINMDDMIILIQQQVGVSTPWLVVPVPTIILSHITANEVWIIIRLIRTI